jgi:hypothetical protein
VLVVVERLLTCGFWGYVKLIWSLQTGLVALSGAVRFVGVPMVVDFLLCVHMSGFLTGLVGGVVAQVRMVATVADNYLLHR